MIEKPNKKIIQEIDVAFEKIDERNCITFTGIDSITKMYIPLDSFDRIVDGYLKFKKEFNHE